MTRRVSDVFRQKGREVISTSRTTTVYDAIATMVEHNVGSILIVDGEALCGIFTERDYLRRIILQGRTSKTTRIEEVMTADLVWVDPNFTLQECLAIMTEKKCRHLPVLDEGRLVGVISIGDCVRELFTETQARVQYLTDYITGQYPA